MEKLGLDIPPPPEVTLEEVTAHEIRIAWKQPDFHNSIHKHIIQVNGAKGNLSILSHIPIPRLVQNKTDGHQWANPSAPKRQSKF